MVNATALAKKTHHFKIQYENRQLYRQVTIPRKQMAVKETVGMGAKIYIISTSENDPEYVRTKLGLSTCTTKSQRQIYEEKAPDKNVAEL